MKISVLCLTLLLISVNIVNAAGISIDTSDVPQIAWNHRIVIRGEIARGDYEKLINVVKKHGSIPPNISLDSGGGDVIEAMKIGRFARRALLTTGVIGGFGNECQGGCVCYSACMLIHLACADRAPSSWKYTSYGIHRPYFDKSYFSGLSAKEAELKYKDLENLVRKYLEEMNVPQSLIETMFSIPSDRMQVLEIPQLIQISGRSPACQEWLLAKCGQMTIEEFNDYRNALATENAHTKHSYSPGYVKYLKDKRSNIFNCEDKSRDGVRQEVFRSLK